jgi:hypothetical protein
MDDPPIAGSPEVEVRAGEPQPGELGIWLVGPEATFSLRHDLLPACGHPF